MPLTSSNGNPLLPRSQTKIWSPSEDTSLSRVVALAATAVMLPAQADVKRAGPAVGNEARRVDAISTRAVG